MNRPIRKVEFCDFASKWGEVSVLEFLLGHQNVPQKRNETLVLFGIWYRDLYSLGHEWNETFGLKSFESTAPSFDNPSLSQIGLYYLRYLLLHFKIFYHFPDPSRYISLEVYDGNSNAAAMIGSYCGSSIPPSKISSRNEMFLLLRLDQYHQGSKGFKLKYQSVVNWLAIF